MIKRILLTLSCSATLSAQICFDSKPLVYNTSDGPNSCVKGDFNGDGKKDFAVVCDRDGSIYRYFGSNAASFTLSKGVSTSSIDYPTVGDLDKDGKDDLVVSQVLYKTVRIQYGKNTVTELSLDFSPYRTAIADVNNDQKQDLVVTNIGNTGIAQIFLGNGAGFGLTLTDTLLPRGVYSLYMKDMNNDTFVDLITSNVVYWGDGTGKFKTYTTLPVDVGVSLLTDLNNDLLPDLIYGHTDSVVVLFNQGNKTFGNKVVSYIIGENSTLFEADINSDGHPDFFNYFGTEGLGLCLGDAQGHFVFSGKYIFANNIAGVISFDANNDAKNDLIIAFRGMNETRVYLNKGTLLPPTVGTDTLKACEDGSKSVTPAAGGTGLLWSFPLPMIGVWIIGDTLAPKVPNSPGTGLRSFYVDQTVNGCRSALSTVLVQVDKCASVGVDDDALQDQVVLYPTLVKEYLHLDLPNSSPALAVISDAQGREQFRLSTFGDIPVRQLRSGVYFVKIEQEGQVAIKQFLKE